MNLNSFGDCRKCNASVASCSDAVRFNWSGRSTELIEVAATAKRWTVSE
jgi:hypothetical protein